MCLSTTVRCQPWFRMTTNVLLPPTKLVHTEYSRNSAASLQDFLPGSHTVPKTHRHSVPPIPTIFETRAWHFTSRKPSNRKRHKLCEFDIAPPLCQRKTLRKLHKEQSHAATIQITESWTPLYHFEVQCWLYEFIKRVLLLVVLLSFKTIVSQ